MISYSPLVSLLESKGMSLRELMLSIGIAPNTATKLRHNEEVSVSVLNRICAELKCDYKDIITYIPNEGGTI